MLNKKIESYQQPKIEFKKKASINMLATLSALFIYVFSLSDVITNNFLGYIILTANLKDTEGQKGKLKETLIREKKPLKNYNMVHVSVTNDQIAINDRSFSPESLYNYLNKFNAPGTLVVIKFSNSNSSIIKEITEVCTNLNIDFTFD